MKYPIVDALTVRPLIHAEMSSIAPDLRYWILVIAFFSDAITSCGKHCRPAPRMHSAAFRAPGRT